MPYLKIYLYETLFEGKLDTVYSFSFRVGELTTEMERTLVASTNELTPKHHPSN